MVSAIIDRLAASNNNGSMSGSYEHTQDIQDHVGFMCELCDVLIPWLDNSNLQLRNAAARAIAILGPFHALPRLCAHGLGPTSTVPLRAATTKAIVEVLVGCDSVNQQATKMRMSAEDDVSIDDGKVSIGGNGSVSIGGGGSNASIGGQLHFHDNNKVPPPRSRSVSPPRATRTHEAAAVAVNTK